jgi:hypothetical protein
VGEESTKRVETGICVALETVAMDCILRCERPEAASTDEGAVSSLSITNDSEMPVPSFCWVTVKVPGLFDIDLL